MEQTLMTMQMNFQRFMNFMGFARSYFVRHNPFMAFANSLVDALKDMLSMKQKLRLSKYRVSYHQHQLNMMEKLIAENNEHTFLRGKKINEQR